MRTILRLLSSLFGRMRGLVSRTVSVVVRPPLRLVRRLARKTRTHAPMAMDRHRQRASRDRSYARTIGEAIAAILSTILERPPYASIATVLLTTWLGTPEASPTGPISTVNPTTARGTEPRDWPRPSEPVPLWDRLQID